MGSSREVGSLRKTLLSCLIFGLFLFLFQNYSYAETTSFRSANTITTDGAPGFTNLANCSVTDGSTCDRVQASSYANLYFSNFGDFAIPLGSAITNVRLRVTGKSNTGIYAGVSPGATYTSNCQSPSDKWTMWELNSTGITTYTSVTPISDGLIFCFTSSNIQTSNFIWKVNYSGFNWFANIDNFELAFDYSPPVTPTFTPTPTSTPTPSAPQPFLDLPWDYQSQGKSFSDVALNPFSWFDHEYPLQNFCCEPPVMYYKGKTISKNYRSHSGYDYASDDGVVLDTPVLAAAPGWATFEPEAESGGAGNIIKIDHGNGYQTWYEHLAGDELIVSIPGQRVYVNKGQKIGKVGMTGNTTGPHIHLSVFKDSNGNGTFDDDYPWGLTDPLGWEGENPDPWTLWESGGRHGASSYNLFIARTPPKSEEILPTGGSVALGDILIDTLSGTFGDKVTIVADNGPFESANDFIKSIRPSVFLDAFDSFGQKITQFLQPISITYDYAAADLLNINENSLKIYWFNKQIDQWEPLPSLIDTINKKVSTQTTHFSQFALMGEVKDLVSPITDVVVSGEKGQDGWYRSDVKVELNGHDNDGGVGLLYTLYTLNGADWFEYKAPIIFIDEGVHTITYQSFDKADNKEERKTIEFTIDKTPPEVEISYSLANIILATGKDGSKSASVTWQDSGGGNKKIVVTDRAGNTLTIMVKTLASRLLSWITLQSLQYNTNAAVTLEKNNFLVTPIYNLKTGQLNSIGQVYSLKDKNVIGIIYSLSTNKTKIYTYDLQNKQLFKEELGGVHLLQLSTQNSTLKYRY